MHYRRNSSPKNYTYFPYAVPNLYAFPFSAEQTKIFWRMLTSKQFQYPMGTKTICMWNIIFHALQNRHVNYDIMVLYHNFCNMNLLLH